MALSRHNDRWRKHKSSLLVLSRRSSVARMLGRSRGGLYTLYNMLQNLKALSSLALKPTTLKANSLFFALAIDLIYGDERSENN